MADANAESIQQKIQIARRDAEALKDRIKRKKDELADTTRESESLARLPACWLHIQSTSLTFPSQSAMSLVNEQKLCLASA